MGFPARRRRTFAAGIRRDKYVWVGPESEAEVREAWLKMFGRKPQLTGDAYFVASKHEWNSWVRKTAATRGFVLPEGWESQTMGSYLPAVLPPGAVSRHWAHMMACDESDKSNLSFLCDLDHNVGYGPRSGESMPVLDTHATIYSRNHDRILLPSELAAVMGFDTQERLRGRRPFSVTGQAILNLPDKDLKAVVGNAMHIPSFASWVIFVLAHMVKRPRDVVPTMLPTRSSTEEFEDDA